MNLPNTLTVGRIVISPLVALLPFAPSWPLRFAAFALFIVVAVTDYWDGKLARSRNLVTRLGTLLDPLADKLLLLATLIPIYWISQERKELYGIPVWGSIPLWVCLLLLGREFAMTAFRQWAKHRGVIIAAGRAGKLKTAFQSIFIGATIAWFAFREALGPMGWRDTPLARFWTHFHGGFVAVTLAIATALTVYSFAVYVYRNRALFRG